MASSHTAWLRWYRSASTNRRPLSVSVSVSVSVFFSVWVWMSCSPVWCRSVSVADASRLVTNAWCRQLGQKLCLGSDEAGTAHYETNLAPL